MVEPLLPKLNNAPFLIVFFLKIQERKLNLLGGIAIVSAGSVLPFSFFVAE